MSEGFVPAYRYPIDTSIVSDLVRIPQGGVMFYIARVGENKIGTKFWKDKGLN